MANIVLIENDKKVQAEIRQLIKELDGEVQLAVYESTKDFEDVFFPTTLAQKPFETHALLKDLNEEEQSFLLQREQSQNPHKPCIFILSPDGETIQDIMNKDLKTLGYERFELIEQRQIWNTLLPQPFRARWTSALKDMSQPKTIRMGLALLNKEQHVHFCSIHLQISPGQPPRVELQDAGSEVAPLIIQERQRRQELENNKTDPRPFLNIHVILIRSGVPTNTLVWVHNTAPKLDQFKYNPEGTQTHCVVMKFEDDGVSALDFIHPRIDDVFHLPFDRMLFLQKLDIILNFPKKISPRFLFQMPTEQPIEISKRAQVEELSDIGLAMVNPVPLKEGTLGNFYLKIPGDTETLNVFGKVFLNKKRANGRGYLVYFAFIGLPRPSQVKIRKYLSKTQGYQPLKNDDPKAFEFNPDDLFLSHEDKKVRNIIMLDVNARQIDQTTDILNADMDRIRIVTESSLSRLLQVHLNNGAAANNYFERLKSCAPMKPNELPASPFRIIINPNNKIVMEFDPIPPADKTLLGHAIHEWAGKDTWLKALFPDKDLIETFEEALRLVLTEKSLSQISIGMASDQTYRAFNLDIAAHPDGNVILSFGVPDLATLQKRLLSQRKIESLDMLIMDSAFFTDSPDALISAIETAAKAASLIPAGQSLNVVILVDETRAKNLNLKKFDNASIRGVFLKPADPKTLLFSLSYWSHNQNTKYNFENINWQPVQWQVHLATDIVLEEVSEFGASLRYPFRLSPGTVLFLRGSIYASTAEQNIAVRFYLSEEHPAHKGQWTNAVLYFGITDAFTKFARNYFREHYAQSKAKEGA